MTLEPVTNHITVCIPTYKRRNLLRNLLYKLLSQDTDGLFTYSILVVDNDYTESARDIVRSFMNYGGLSVEYLVEPVQNISLARNKAVKSARGNLIAFIDDDEYPAGKDWLLNMFKAYKNFGCTAVLGPVYSEFQGTPPSWLKKCSFFYRYNCNYETSHKLRWNEGNTRNLLIRKEVFDLEKDHFDVDFGRTGGEDSDFFRRLFQKGYTCVWCKEAVTHEVIPSQRWKIGWLLRRALRSGGAYSRLRLKNGNYFSGISVAAEAVIYFSVYLLSLPFSLFLGIHVFVNVLMGAFCQIGKFLGLFGYVIHEYET